MIEAYTCVLMKKRINTSSRLLGMYVLEKGNKDFVVPSRNRHMQWHDPYGIGYN